MSDQYLEHELEGERLAFWTQRFRILSSDECLVCL